MSVFKPINMKVAGETTPYFIYKQIPISHPREPFLFTINYTNGYMLRSIVAHWPTLGRFFAGELKIEFFNQANFKSRQNVPVDLALLSTPAQNTDSRSFTEPNGVLTMTQGQRTSRKILNFFYPYNDTIHLEISGQYFSSSNAWEPEYVDIMLEGYYIPEPTKKAFGGR
jgi:hypothetical protein